MKTREIEIDGQKFNVPQWTVKDRRNAMVELQEIAKTSEADMIKANDLGIKFVSKHSGLPFEQLEELDALTYDKLYLAIARGNSSSNPTAGQQAQ